MKLCITSKEPSLGSQIDLRFGRCPYFLIIDGKGDLIESVENSGTQVNRGAGIQAAQIAAEKKVDAIITGNVGPSAVMALEQAGIKIYINNSNITAKEAFDLYKNGKLEEYKQ